MKGSFRTREPGIRQNELIHHAVVKVTKYASFLNFFEHGHELEAETKEKHCIPKLEVLWHRLTETYDAASPGGALITSVPLFSPTAAFSSLRRRRGESLRLPTWGLAAVGNLGTHRRPRCSGRRAGPAPPTGLYLMSIYFLRV